MLLMIPPSIRWECHAARRRTDRRATGRGAAAHPCPALRPRGAHRAGAADPRLRGEVVEACRRQGAGDPGHLRPLLDALLPTAERVAGQSGGTRAGPGAGRAPPPAAVHPGAHSPALGVPITVGAWRRAPPARPPGAARVTPAADCGPPPRSPR